MNEIDDVCVGQIINDWIVLVVKFDLNKSERQLICAGLMGNIVESYDFGVYGFFAATIGKQFFPANDPSVSLLSSLGVFAAGFIARPIGGIIIGGIGDLIGRRAAVMSSVILMIIPTLLMALLPTYASIGIAAPIALVLMRMLQGLSVGGEFTTSMVLLVEEAHIQRRGFIGSFAPVGSLLGILLGSIVGATINYCLTPENLETWGWRIAFLIGSLIGLAAFLVRWRFSNSQDLEADKSISAMPLVIALKSEWRTIIKIVAFNLRTQVGFYLCFIYITTWSSINTRIDKSITLAVNSIALALFMVCIPVGGYLYDRYGYKRILALGALISGIFSIPLFNFMTSSDVFVVFAGQSLFALIMSSTGGGPAFMSEVFSKEARCTALSIGYNISATLFGGTVPFISELLVQKTNDNLSPAYYLAAASLVSLWATVNLGRDYNRIDQ